MDMNTIADALHSFSLDDLWAWMAALAAALTAMVMLVLVLAASSDVS